MTTQPNNDFLEKKLKEFDEKFNKYDDPIANTVKKMIVYYLTQHHNELIDEIVNMGEEMKIKENAQEDQSVAESIYQKKLKNIGFNQGVTNYQKKIQSLKHKGNEN